MGIHDICWGFCPEPPREVRVRSGGRSGRGRLPTHTHTHTASCPALLGSQLPPRLPPPTKRLPWVPLLQNTLFPRGLPRKTVMERVVYTNSGWVQSSFEDQPPPTPMPSKKRQKTMKSGRIPSPVPQKCYQPFLFLIPELRMIWDRDYGPWLPAGVNQGDLNSADTRVPPKNSCFIWSEEGTGL